MLDGNPYKPSKIKYDSDKSTFEKVFNVVAFIAFCWCLFLITMLVFCFCLGIVLRDLFAVFQLI